MTRVFRLVALPVAQKIDEYDPVPPLTEGIGQRVVVRPREEEPVDEDDGPGAHPRSSSFEGDLETVVSERGHRQASIIEFLGPLEPADQLSLQHLAGARARQLVDALDTLGDLERGELALAGLHDLVFGRVPYDKSSKDLSVLFVLHSEDGGFRDAVDRLDDLFDLDRVDVLAADDDHVVGAALDEEKAVFVDPSEVADRHVPLSLLLRFPGRVALEVNVRLDEELADFTRGRSGAVLREHRDVRSGHRLADRLGICPYVVGT